MWTSEIVRVRFIEAAATERFLPTLRKPNAKGYWPEFRYEKTDLEGWDQQAHDDHMEIWQGRGTAKADALSRYQECLSWTIERIENPDRRRLVWGFAFCRANKRDFGKWLRERGFNKTTSYNRLNRIWEQLAFNFNNERVLLREAAAKWGGREVGPIVPIGNTGETCALVTPIKFSRGYRTEKSSDLLKNDGAVADFSKHLEAVNAERRRLQEREAKRRAKIGAMAS